jgi:sugar lactone lactonase YvrE
VSPIVPDEYFKVVCDHCGEAFPEHESGGGYTLYETEKEAREEAGYYDGRVDPDGRVWCLTCIEEGLAPAHTEDKGEGR